MANTGAFRGDRAFLSNMYPCKAHVDGITYMSSEAAFQAAKTLIPEERAAISRMNGYAAKKAGGRNGTITLRADYNAVRLQIMEDAVRAKFTQNIPLANMLLATGDEILEERNTWGDTYWGTDMNGVGQNNLGKILMKVREEIRAHIARNKQMQGI